METLTPETLAWARKVGLPPERVAFLLACPKYTVCHGQRKFERNVKDNPNHHPQRLGRINGPVEQGSPGYLVQDLWQRRFHTRALAGGQDHGGPCGHGELRPWESNIALSFDLNQTASCCDPERLIAQA